MDNKDSVKDYYGKRLTSSDDLQTTAVTSCSRKTEKIPAFIKEALGRVHDDIASRAYGCATAYPEALKGAKMLDLGSGCGRDVYVLSQVVGEDGRVVGLDMTDELLELSSSKIDYHTQAFGYKEPNVKFVKGYMEKMTEAGLEDNYFDVIVSNCVISLCRDKRAVLSEASRVLKPGGEIYFSDIYRDGKVPEEVKDDEELWCEGLVGSLGYKDLHAIAKDLGYSVPRVVKADDLPILDSRVKAKLPDCRYASVTFRLYKRPETPIGSGPSDVVYKGGIQGYEEAIKFDQAATLQKGVPTTVDGELADIILSSRFKPFFEVSPAQGNAQLPSLDVDPFTLFEAGSKKSCSS